MMTPKISQRMQFRVTKNNGEMHIFDIFNVCPFEILANDQLIAPKKNSLNFSGSLKNINHPLNMS